MLYNLNLILCYSHLYIIKNKELRKCKWSLPVLAQLGVGIIFQAIMNKSFGVEKGF